MKHLRSALAVFAMVALAGCGGDDSAESPSSAEAPAESSAAPEPTEDAATAEEGGGETGAEGGETADSGGGESGGLDTSRGGEVTCSEWNDASRDEKYEIAAAFLDSEGQPSDEAEAALASIDFDVYCAGGQHADEPIAPGFEGN